MLIKKILLFSSLIIFIPFIVVTLFIRDDEITFNFSQNSVVRVFDEESNTISYVPIEEYVVGVVAGEMPIEFELEALKAQAVAARSYVMIQMERNIKKDYDVVDTVMNQVYLDKEYLITAWKNSYTENINKVKTAVLETKGEYISYNDKVAEALFFSTSPGVTENSEDVFTNKVAYLRSVESIWDEISPVYTSNTTYTLKEFYNLLNLDYNEELNIEITNKTSTGRVKKIKINGKELTGSYVCSKLELRSTFFEIIKEDNKIIIKNKGYGHGVGMSQYGAQGMAKAGYTYQDILKHYYTGIEIKKF
ncbi:MAG: stage II sporulation protein D [Firmicutes bacterium]|nr:stage II sporulation protein D [Bacillota bacterium]